MANTATVRMQVQTLLDYCWDDENTALVDAIIEKGREKLLSGEQIGALTVATENGKSMTREVGMSAEAALYAARTAKKWYAAGYHEIPRKTQGIFA